MLFFLFICPMCHTYFTVKAKRKRKILIAFSSLYSHDELLQKMVLYIIKCIELDPIMDCTVKTSYEIIQLAQNLKGNYFI